MSARFYRRIRKQGEYTLTNGRAIGAGFERKIATMLHDELGGDYKFKRCLEQYRAKDYGDLVCEVDFPFSIECKRRGGSQKTYSLEWWEQCKRAAEYAGKHPVLIYQLMRSPIKCVLDLNLIVEVMGGTPTKCEYLVEMPIETFCMIAREMI